MKDLRRLYGAHVTGVHRRIIVEFEAVDNPVNGEMRFWSELPKS